MLATYEVTDMGLMMSTGLSRSEEAILAVIRGRGQVTRGDVALAADLSMAMTARVVTSLQELGLVREAGRAAVPGPGRQASLLEIHPDAAYLVGVDIGVEVIRLIVADLHGVVQVRREVAADLLVERTQEEIVALLAQLIRALIHDTEISAPIVAVGVSLTGIIDSERGVCLVRSHTPGWENFALSERLGQALGLPVGLEETARAKSLAEARLGVAKGVPHFLYVEAGMVIGAGIVINGQPFRGIWGLAGEIGHLAVDGAGPLCRCGNRGCVQASASAQAVVAQAREHLAQGVFSSLADQAELLDLSVIALAADHGDQLALRLLTEAGERLGEAISMALNLLGMDVVVLGGVLTASSPVVLEAAARVVRLRVLPIVRRERTLMQSGLGSDAAACGAVLQAIDWLFEDPGLRILRQQDQLSQVAV